LLNIAAKKIRDAGDEFAVAMYDGGVGKTFNVDSESACGLFFGHEGYFF
jgi:hypothetical protein